MKKILIFVLVAVLLFSCTACKKTNDDKEVAPSASEENGDGNNGGTDNSGSNNGGTNNGGNDSNTDGEEKLPGVDYLRDDLSDYVEIDEKYYKGYTVNVDPNRVTALDVENRIIQLLRKNKNGSPVEGDGVITPGDIVYIYYKGYYIKDGEPHYFEGGDNTNEQNPYTLEIGSGSFILGFEYNLVGVRPVDHNESNPIVIETYFPDNYQSSELAGKTAYFIVTVDKHVEYDAPEFDDDFITNKMNLGGNALDAYEGETLQDRCRSYLYEQIIVENGLDEKSLAIDAFWTSVLNGVKVKKYPEQQLKEACDDLIAELEYYYQYYTYMGYKYTYDDFMCAYIGLAAGSDWKAYVTEIAKEQVKQRLVFYHIMNVEGYKPTEEEYAELFSEYVIDYLAQKGVTEDKYATREDYLEKVAGYTEQMLTQNGEDYYRHIIYYEVVIEEILKLANFVTIEV